MEMQNRIKLIAGFIAYASFLAGEAQSQVAWQRNMDKAREQARRERKLILADFWAHWCGPCLAMDRHVWSQKDVTELSEKFVCVKINADFSRSLMMQYELKAIPAMLFLDGFGNALFHFTGYKSAGEMKGIMQSLPAEFAEMYEILSLLEEQPDSLAPKIKLADYYLALGMSLFAKLPVNNLFLSSNKYYKSAWESKEIKDHPQLLDRVETCRALNHLFLGEAGKAKKLAENCLKAFPASENRPAQLYCLVRANWDLGEQATAREYLTRLESEYPDSDFFKWAIELSSK